MGEKRKRRRYQTKKNPDHPFEINRKRRRRVEGEDSRKVRKFVQRKTFVYAKGNSRKKVRGSHLVEEDLLERCRRTGGLLSQNV